MSRRASPADVLVAASPSQFSLFLRRLLVRLSHKKSIRFAEFALLATLFAATGIYGAVRGGHMPIINAWMTEISDRVAHFAGFEIADADVRGHNKLRRDDILAAAGITSYTSLVLLDADRARERLKSNPWIAEAVIRKLYPNRIEIEVSEREAFALWQRNGKLAVISHDGTVLEEVRDARPEKLPLVVGEGAAKHAAELLAVLDRYPAIKTEVYGAIFIAERRWNLRLNSGMDVRLPEGDPEAALAILVKLNREQGVLSRDITIIDLRIPGQIVVRMSDAAAAALDAQRKPAKSKGAS